MSQLIGLRRGLAVGLLFLFVSGQHAAAQKPEDVDWFWCRGEANATPELRIARCTAFLERKGHSSELLAAAFSLRGDAHYDRSDWDRSLADHDEALKRDPKLKLSWNQRGYAKYRKGSFEGAIADFTSAIALDPLFGYGFPFYYRGASHLAMKSHDRAIADFTLAIRIDPEKNTRALESRGQAYRVKGDLDAAIADYSAFIARAATSPLVQAGGLNARGLIYYSKGDLPRAVADFDAAIRIEPTAARYYNRGMAKLKNGDAGGNADIARAQELQPGIGQKP
jgi:tetratricopeptide (TPR) repeat protein